MTQTRSWSWTGPKLPPLPQALTLGAPHYLAGLPLPKGTQGVLWNALKTAPIHLFPPHPHSPHSYCVPGLGTGHGDEPDTGAPSGAHGQVTDMDLYMEKDIRMDQCWD